MRMRRSLALVLVITFAGSACGLSRANRAAPSPTGPFKYGEDTGEPGSENASGGQTPSPGTNQGGGKNTVPTFKSSPYSPGQPIVEPDELDDSGPGGADVARWILAAKPFTEIVIEIDYVSGMQPTQLAKSHLVNTLKNITGKKVTLKDGNLMESRPTGETSSSDIKRISQRRANRSVEPVAAIWIGYFNGSASQSSNILGIAVAGTVVGMFPERIQSISTPPVLSRDVIERSVLLHEVGHVLALVNVGYQSPRPHQDVEHGHHSNNRDSVMYWAVEDISLANVFRGGPPYTFDADDLADMADLAAGRL